MSKGGPHIGGPKGWSGEHTKRSAVRSHGTPHRRRRGRCEDAERPLRIEGGSGGGARSARPVGEAARSKPNEQGSTASRQAQQDDHCELWGACSPVHQRVKKYFFDTLRLTLQKSAGPRAYFPSLARRTGSAFRSFCRRCIRRPDAPVANSASEWKAERLPRPAGRHPGIC